MKTQKLNLKSIKNVLSRAEMKKIMAGSGGGGGCDVNGVACAPWTFPFIPCCSGFCYIDKWDINGNPVQGTCLPQ